MLANRERDYSIGYRSGKHHIVAARHGVESIVEQVREEARDAWRIANHKHIGVHRQEKGGANGAAFGDHRWTIRTQPID